MDASESQLLKTIKSSTHRLGEDIRLFIFSIALEHCSRAEDNKLGHAAEEVSVPRLTRHNLVFCFLAV